MYVKPTKKVLRKLILPYGLLLSLALKEGNYILKMLYESQIIYKYNGMPCKPSNEVDREQMLTG